MRLFSSLILILLTLYVRAQNFTEWAHYMSNNSANNEAHIIKANNQGKVYISGEFFGTVDLNPSQGTQLFTSVNDGNAYIQNLDTNGNFINAIAFGNGGGINMDQLIIARNGDIIITGDFTQTPDFDPGSGVQTLTCGGVHDGFILRLDSNLNFIWVKHLISMNSNNNSKINGLAQDQQNNIIISGWYGGTVDFDPGAGTYLVTSPTTGGAFILKLTNNGNFVWIQSEGGTDGIVGYTIVTDSSNNIYFHGTFHGTVDFDPDSGTYYASTGTVYGTQSAFYQKFNSNGDMIWTKILGSNTTLENGFGIDLDKNGNLYGIIYTDGTIDFDPNSGTLYGSGNTVFKWDSTGNMLWTKFLGSSSGGRLEVDDYGSVITSGVYNDSVDLDPSNNKAMFYSKGNRDGYIVKLDSMGDYIWGGSWKSNYFIRILSIYSELNVTYVAGIIRDSTNIDPFFNSQWVTVPSNRSNSYIAKFNNCFSSTYIDTIHDCDSFYFNNQFLYVNGIFIDTLHARSGCDSIVNLQLTIYHSSSNYDSLTSCDSIIILGNSYYSSQNIMDTLSSANGCDSIVITDLVINYSLITYKDTTITFLDSIVLGGTIQVSSGIYYDTLSTINDCDSIVTTNLAIDSTTFGFGELIESGVSVYPNPFNNSFRVVISTERRNLSHNEPLSIKLYDLLGKEVDFSLSAEMTNNNIVGNIDTKFLPKGIYTLEVSHLRGDGRGARTKIIKQ